MLYVNHALLQLSVLYYHHEENEASYADWLSSKYLQFTLSEWWICISSCTLFTRMVCSSKSESAQTKNIMDTAHPRGVASHPIHPLTCLYLASFPLPRPRPMQVFGWTPSSRMHICVLGVKIYTAARACFSVHSGILNNLLGDRFLPSGLGKQDSDSQ